MAVSILPQMDKSSNDDSDRIDELQNSDGTVHMRDWLRCGSDFILKSIIPQNVEPQAIRWSMANGEEVGTVRAG